MSLLVLLATMVVTSAWSSGFDWLYPLRVVTTSVTLWSCRTGYRLNPWTWSWPCDRPRDGHLWHVDAPGANRSPPRYSLGRWPRGAARRSGRCLGRIPSAGI